jgi:hypothetical protein
MPAQDTQERTQRDSVMLMARIHAPGSLERSEHRVRNLPAHGICIEHSTGLSRGEALFVDLGQLTEIAAEVMWSRGTLTGLRFQQAIDVAAARKRRSASTAVKSGWAATITDPYRE